MDETLGLLIAIVLGLGFGSYSTMPYYRLPNKVPCAGRWVGEKSACPQCGVQLRQRDYIPLFNWLITMGKCFSCGKKIDPTYLVLELTNYCLVGGFLHEIWL